ncbi:MAG: hypothetical protein AB7E96_11585 [Deferribacterales bacterium]
MGLLIFMIILHIGCGIAAAMIADKKNRNPLTGFLYGVTMLFLGVIIAHMTSKVEKYDEYGIQCGGIKENRGTD